MSDVIKNKNSLKPKSGSKSRTKGHNFERQIAQYFRDLGYDRTITTRQGSRQMDAAKLDLCNVPFNVQCKAVESNINYDSLIKEVEAGVLDLVPERKELPILLFHKKAKKTHIVMNLKHFRLLFEYLTNSKKT